MTPEDLLKLFLSELAANELWIADAGPVERSLDDRVVQMALAYMKQAKAVEITATDEQNLLAAVQMAGLGNLDQEALDCGPAQRVYSLACELADEIRRRRRAVAQRHQQRSRQGSPAVPNDIDDLLKDL